MIVVAVQDSSYATALAAFEISAKRADDLGSPDLAARFRDALRDFERAYLHAIERQADTTIPSLLKRQV